MKGTAQALSTYYNSFGIEAYHEMTVPDDAQYPYITYNLQQNTLGEHGTHYVQVFDRSTSNASIIAMADKITKDIGTGKMLECEGGYVCLRPGFPLVQILVDEQSGGPTVRRAYINLQIDTYN